MTHTQEIRQITQQDLATLGVQQIAYVKPVETDQGTAFAVYAADGRQMAVMDDRDKAFAAVRQHDLEPFSVH
ncbi:MAG: DUF1150 family protein [Rhodovibrionaceae bacterium]|nr:DUF1150 family protein [Rhodovibrionaceae bacterium]